MYSLPTCSYCLIEKSNSRILCINIFCSFDLYTSVKEVLKRAHVPPRHGVYVERKEKIKKIQNELYKLKDEDGYDPHKFAPLGCSPDNV